MDFKKINKRKKLQIIRNKIFELYKTDYDENYIDYYSKKITLIYIKSNYNYGIYQIITRYRLITTIYDTKYMLKLIKYYIKSKYNKYVLKLILDSSITMGNKIIILEDITEVENLNNDYLKKKLAYLLKRI